MISTWTIEFHQDKRDAVFRELKARLGLSLAGSPLRDLGIGADGVAANEVRLALDTLSESRSESVYQILCYAEQLGTGWFVQGVANGVFCASASPEKISVAGVLDIFIEL